MNPRDPTPPIASDQAQQAVANQQGDQAPPPVVKQCPNSKTWIEVRLLDMEGNPVPGKKCRIKTSTGQVKESALDKDGKMRFDGIDPGSCTISFPELDMEAWEPV